MRLWAGRESFREASQSYSQREGGGGLFKWASGPQSRPPARCLCEGGGWATAWRRWSGGGSGVAGAAAAGVRAKLRAGVGVMSGRQRTLFQTWGSSVSRAAGAPGCGSGAGRPRSPGVGGARSPAAAGAAEAEPEVDDDVLLVAVYEAERQLGLESGGFCASAGALWIYPTNCPVRDYQLRIARAALFCNTLVCLPTGLGKTFIAAVVMYNFYRWFPSGKVVFMAPTKPLVTQQIEACYRVMGIPQPDMAEMTGCIQAFTRKEIWRSKRVLFLTPQVMVNDLSRGSCPAAEIKCLVIDEAHKALGNYAYCQVVRELVKYTNHFRILALSATPGSDIKAVQQVITNLLIGQIELRSEDSPDILPYSHERRVEKLVVPLGEELAAIQKAYIQILETFASSLIQRNVLKRRDIPSLTKYQIILARDQFRKNPSPNIMGIQGIIEGEFAICISLYHGYELLQQMGMRSLYFFLCGIMDGTKGMTRAKNELSRNEDFMALYNHLEGMFAQTQGASAGGTSATQKGDKDKTFFYSHPKLKKLEEVVVDHFKSWNAQNASEKKCDKTRVMIFSSFRDSVQEIAEMLLQHQPMIRVMTFVGHASGKSMKGFTQKEQLEVVKQFRSGGYNTLVSTCVGEEGLDIGEVDLIICFDAQKSPIRLIQRMGRTGRRRQGRIVVILAEGREERTYNQSQSNKRSIYKAISSNRQVLHFYQGSPRMVPDGVNPELHKMFITQSVYQPEKRSRNLPREASVFYCRNGMKQTNSKKDWFLSEEEFKLWTRLYRLKDSDGIKEVTLPRVRFLSLQNEKDRPTQETTAGIRQLSLSEWRLWQDHPLPTHRVGHSDRCHHFISIMQMIEGMRHEEGECSYELEIKSYLQMEDVNSTFSVPRNEYNIPANGIFTTNKKSSFTKKINQGNSFSMTEFDEECAEIFKQTHIKPTKIGSLKKKAEKLKKDQPKKGNDDVVLDSLETDGNSTVENTFQEALLSDKMVSDAEVAASCTISESVVHQPRGLLMECQFTNKSTSSFAGDFLDSGYSSVSDEKSASSGLFLPFEEELSVAGADDQFYNCHSVTKEVLAHVERFLSHSPPPLSGLSNLEYEIAKGSAHENLLFLPYTEYLQNDKSTCLMSHSAVTCQQNVESNSLNLLNHPSEKSCLYGAANAEISDEPSFCDYDNKLHKDIQNENLVSNNHIQINIGPPKYFVEEKNRNVDNNGLPVLSTDQDESLLLFEDVDTESNDVSLSPSKSKHRSMCVSDRTAPSETALVSHFFISDALLFDNNSEPQDPILCDANSRKSHEDLRGICEEKLKNDECVFDCSKDLFSVTFDLGFCSSDSDDEILEHASDTNKNRFLEDLSGRCSDIKERSDVNHVSNQAVIPRDHVDCVMSRTITVTSSEDKQSPNFAHFPLSAAKNKEFMSPGYSQFSLPVGEKVMSTPLSKLNTLNSFSKRKEMHKTPDSNKEKVNLQSFKETLNSTFDDSGLSIEKSKSRRQINLHQSCHSAGDEQLPSNESEDDEIFQRKSRKTKGNVLESPEDQRSSEVDSPLHAVRKRRAPPNRLELSSSDESENFQRRHPQSDDFKAHPKSAKGAIGVLKRQGHLKLVARKFIDDEAELSQEDAECASSDETDDSENEQDSSLLNFLNDETQLSQAINDSEMRAIYMKSLRSPLMRNRYTMVHKKHNNANIFSQIPEQDENYLEDSFCVDEEESGTSQSSEEEACVDSDVVAEDSFASGSKKYKTRHAVKLKQMNMTQNLARSKKKLSRIILLDDSSEEENTVNDKGDSSDMVDPGTVNTSGQQVHTGGQQVHTGRQQGHTSGQQGHTSGQQVLTGGQQVHTGGQQVLTGGQQVHTGGQQVHTGGQQVHISRQQVHTGGQQVHISRQQVHTGGQQVHISREQVHISREQVHTGGQQVHTGGQQVHTGGQQVHTGGQQVHTGRQQVHTGGQQVHTGGQQVHTGGQQVHISRQQVHTGGQQVHISRQQVHISRQQVHTGGQQVHTCGQQVHTSRQQGHMSRQQDPRLSLVPSGSSLPSKDHSHSVVDESAKQRRHTPLNLKDAVSEVSDFKLQSRDRLEAASPLSTAVDSQTDCRKFPVQLKVGSVREDSGSSMAYCSSSRPHLAGTHAAPRFPPEGRRTCILVDSREITSGSEVISSLRAVHGLQVEVCPLHGCGYIVSNRMVVERRPQSEMLNSVGKNKLIDQIQYLQSMFERICVIVEKDREKTGDTSRMFRRTKSYDNLLTTLIGAGIRILFSSCQEETADLLKELSLVEQRKNVGIQVPAVVNSNKCGALQFYLSIPNVSYVTALNMCHQFSSVKKMTNSSPQEISTHAQVPPQKAEEICRYVHHVFDMQMLPNGLNHGGLQPDA
uniref:RNA helicase n=1 Tax=Equus caballus TaxID=9796 RepID=F7B274_HORSE